MLAQMRGAQKGHVTVDVCWTLFLWGDRPRTQNAEWLEISMDRRKYFDTIARGVSYILEVHMGLPEWTTRANERLYDGSQHFIVIGQYAGPRFKSTNGFAQGCSSSVMRGAIWSVSSCMPQSHALAFLDNSSVGSQDRGAIVQSLRESERFDRL